VTTDHADALYLDLASGERIELLRTRYMAQRFAPHAHDTFTVGLGLRGVGSIWYRGANHARRPGDVVVIPAGEVHTGGVGPQSHLLSYMAVYLPQTVLAACGDAEGMSGGLDRITTPVIHDRALAQALRNVNDLLSSGEPAATEEALLSAVTLLVRRFGRPRAVLGSPVTPFDEPRLVRVVRAILDDCYSDPTQTSLRALACHAGVTPFHLIRTFRRATGVSPHQYLVQVRVRRARQFLAGGAPSSLVAAMTGFADQSHLTKQFKRYVGITPAHYQRCVCSRS
jgi:AraC-like DNA-binding protein